MKAKEKSEGKNGRGNLLWILLTLLILGCGFASSYVMESLFPTYKDQIRYFDTEDQNGEFLLLDDSNRVSIKAWDSFQPENCLSLSEVWESSGLSVDEEYRRHKSFLRLLAEKMGDPVPSDGDLIRVCNSILVDPTGTLLYIQDRGLGDGSTLRAIYGEQGLLNYHRSSSQSSEEELENKREQLLSYYQELRDALLAESDLSDENNPLYLWLQRLVEQPSPTEGQYVPWEDGEDAYSSESAYRAESSSQYFFLHSDWLAIECFALYDTVTSQILSTASPSIIAQDGELLLIFTQQQNPVILYYNPSENEITGFSRN